MSVKVAINGFGRIGRNILRSIIENKNDNIKVVGINDLGPIETNAHLLKYDSVHGLLNKDIIIKKAGEHIFIPLEAIHRVQNPGKKPVKIVEAQIGSILKESDIVRYQDVYGRVR